MALFHKHDKDDASSTTPQKSGTMKRAASSKLAGGKASAPDALGTGKKDADKTAGAAGRKTAGEKADKVIARAARQAKEGAPSKAARRREHKEKLGKAGKYVLVAIGVAAMLLSVTAMACSGVLNQVSSGGEQYHLTGGVAAEVKGVNITEDTVTQQIMSTRQNGGYDTDAAWATYLAGQDLTPETLREQVIDSLARQYLLTQAVNEYEITVSDEEIDDELASQAEAYGMSADEYVSQMTSIGYTEDTLRQSVASSLEQQKLREEVAPLEDPTDQEIIDDVNSRLDTLNDARRSSHILIKVDANADEATKEEARQKLEDLRAQIEAGDISFEDAAKENSEDSSASDGGDVGWDKLTTFVTAYQDALSALQPGEMSGVVESDYGYHLILCTELFHVDGEVTSIDQIPEDLRTQISDSLASSAQSTAYSEWLDGYVEDAGVTINPMPEDVPYNVDMSLAGTEDTSSDSGDATADAATNENSDAAADDGTATSEETE